MYLAYSRIDSLSVYPEFFSSEAAITTANSGAEEIALCTDELLGLQRIERTFFRITALRDRSHVQPQGLFLHVMSVPDSVTGSFLHAHISEPPAYSISRHISIISYIHHQDGAKG